MNLIRLLMQYSSQTLIFAVVTGVLSGGSAAGLIALINLVLEQNVWSVETLAWMFAGLCLLRLVTNFASQVLLVHLSQTAVFDLRLGLSKRILAAPLRHLETIGAHRLLATLTGDIQSISDTAFILPFVFVNIAILLGCQIYLLWLSPMVFLIATGFLFLGAVSYQMPTVKAFSLLKQARDQEDKLLNHFRAIILGSKELKLNSHRRHEFFSEDLRPAALSYRSKSVLGNTVFAAAASWGQTLFFICIGLLLFALPAVKTIEAAVLSGYTLTIIYVMTPLEYIARMMPPLSKATVALKKIESLGLDLPPELAQTNSKTRIFKHAWHSLRLSNVTHTYYQEKADDQFTLGPIELTFYPGELVFILGGNGSGKSTLAKLIAGLYTPETGQIYLGDDLIQPHNQEWYRQQFSAVFSDFYLFERCLGIDPQQTSAKVKDYLQRLQLDHKVEVIENRLSTTALSQGQRKRLALLAAYLEDRPIYLFDEWASDQDPVFKKIFYTQILPELKRRGKAVLVITHDDQYFDLADRIVKLEYGQLVHEHHYLSTAIKS